MHRSLRDRIVRRTCRTVLFLLTIMLALGAQPARAWWNADWAYRQAITIDTGAQGAHVQDRAFDVPVVIRLHTGNFPFDQVKPDGSDLRVVTGDDKTPLPFAIERFARDSGMAIIRVLVPVLDPGQPAKLWLYYGNAKAEAAGDRSAVRDRLALMAFDFEALDAGLKDRTAYGNSPASSTLKSDPGGVIGDAARFAATDSVAIAASPSLSAGKAGGAALGFWLRPDAPGTIVAIGDPASPALLATADATGAVTVRLRPASGAPIVLGSGPVAVRGWHHFAVTITATTAILYVDGVEKARAAAPDVLPLGGAVTLGAVNAGAGFAGLLDDLQFDKTARAPDWIRATVAAAQPQARLVALGAVEQKSQVSAYFAMLGGIAAMVSLDGWVIIGFTLVLGFIAGEVTVTKLAQLRGIERGNAGFIAAEASGDAQAHFARSPFARIEATARKVAAVREDDGAVPEGQVELVRSAIARTQIDEAAALNKGLVMLTLTISGAPFLGLLGTVIGVMVTFAAIAASGDVNVNTIAPGISAALACTVVGLIVAIPTVFAYNILMARIREQLTAMDVYGEDALIRAALALKAAARRSGTGGSDAVQV